MLGITIGTAALICVLSVFNGFNGVVRGLLVGFDPHLRITSLDSGVIQNPQEVLRVLKANPEVTGAGAFITGRSAIIHNKGLRVIQIRGMSKADIGSAVGLQKKIISGEFQEPPPEQQVRSIVLGNILAYTMNASSGDTIALLSQSGVEEAMTAIGQPSIVRCVISGIYESANKDYDQYVAYTDMTTARALFNMKAGAMGVEARVSDLNRAIQVRDQLAARLGPAYRIETWQDLHRDLFAVMELERWAAFIILSLIILVAAFSVFGSLTMTVIEKHRDIGIMKTMGAGDRAVMRIFMLEGLLVGVIGSIAGSCIGVGLCLLQMKYGFLGLDNNFYIIPAVPVEVRWTDVALVALTALTLSSLAAVYPARRAARLQPAQAVRIIE